MAGGQMAPAALVLLLLCVSPCRSSRSCRLGVDYGYEYTACDRRDGRWRVAVPLNDTGSLEGCDADALPRPARAPSCAFTCNDGQYLDIASGDCANCPAGTYSLKGAVRYSDFEALPENFAVHNALPRDLQAPTEAGAGKGDADCPKDGGWQVWRGTLAYWPSAACLSELALTVELAKRGRLIFVYRLPRAASADADVYFTVNVQNDQCRSVFDEMVSKYRQTHGHGRKGGAGDQSKSGGGSGGAERGRWQSTELELRPGRSVVTWTVRPPLALAEAHAAVLLKPILLSTVVVHGVSATEHCSKCPAGYYSSADSKTCTPCEPNTYSEAAGSRSCKPCSSEHYSQEGWRKCLSRPPCTSADYYRQVGACAGDGRATAAYKWVEPRVCLDDLPQSVRLPESESAACGECNPGMAKGPAGGKCAFCGENRFSDGGGPCEQCGAHTAPNYGYQYTHWDSLPDNMRARCEIAAAHAGEADASQRAECSGVDSWLPAGDRIHTAPTRRDDVVLELLLETEPFDNPLLSGEPSARNPVARASFVFDTRCARPDCTLYFVQLFGDESFVVLNSWNGTNAKQSYVHIITQREKVTFGWVFLRSETKGDGGDDYVADQAAIYAINVTNSNDKKGASACLPCPISQSAKVDGCVPCAAGEYVDASTHACVRCPPGTELNATSNRVGAGACAHCGPHMASAEGGRCATDGKIALTAGNWTVDISALRGKHFTVSGVRIYGHEGAPYYHVFNVSLLDAADARCYDYYPRERAATDGDDSEPDAQPAFVSAALCRATALPVNDNATDGVAYVAPLVLGARLLGISDEHELGHIKVDQKVLDALGSTEDRPHVHLFYTSDGPATGACVHGHLAVVTLQCDPGVPVEKTEATLPPQCPDGTCDGCTYHVVLRTSVACALCTPSDYSEIRGECSAGAQLVHYIAAKHCVLAGAGDRPAVSEACFAISGTVVWFAVGLAMCACVMCLMLVATCRRNRKLEYRYSKLVESRSSAGEYAMAPSGGGGQLPAVESCALHSDDEDEDEQLPRHAGSQKADESERVSFSGGGRNRLGRARALFSRAPPAPKRGGGGYAQQEHDYDNLMIDE